MPSNQNDGPDVMFERYQRAAAALHINSLAALAGSTVEGYWLDEKRFFFLSERWDASAKRVVEEPTIVDAVSKDIRRLATPDDLVALIAEQDAPVTFDELFFAQIDLLRDRRLAIKLGNRGFIVDLQLRKIVEREEFPSYQELYSPDGTMAIAVDNGNITLRDRGTGVTRPLTDDGVRLHPYARLPDYDLAPLTDRRNPKPVGLWSEDSEWFLTHQIDERAGLDMPFVQHVLADGGRPILHNVKWTGVGDPLPLTTLVAVNVRTGQQVRSAPMAVTPFSPIMRGLAWFSSSRTYCFIRTGRFHQSHELVEVSLETGKERVLVHERTDHGYLDLQASYFSHPNVRTLPSSDEVIWYSERDGWGHLFLYDAKTGSCKNQITVGSWQVRDIVYIDELRRRILFTAGGLDPTREPGLRSLCRISFNGEDFTVLLVDEGDVEVRNQTRPLPDRAFGRASVPWTVSEGGRFVVCRKTSVDTGSRTVIVDLELEDETTIAETDKASVPRHPPQRFEVLAADKKTTLHGILYFPSDFDETHSYPLIDYVYTGSQSSPLPRAFGMVQSAQAQALAELGSIVTIMDTRGMPFRAREIHQADYGVLMEPQLMDHASAVEQLCSRFQYLDRGRVGMIGSSAGGTATAQALFNYPEVFKVGASICGCHKWLLYRTGWIDKYLGADHSRDALNTTDLVAGLEGKLFLIAGEMDENVHLSQIFELTSALIKANKDFEQLILPNEGHDLQSISAYAQRRIWDFFVKNLIGGNPPREFDLRYGPADLARLRKRLAQDAQWR